MMTLLHIAAIMLPTMVLCGALLYAAGLFGYGVSRPPQSKVKPRKRPINQGPKTRIADRLPRKSYSTLH